MTATLSRAFTFGSDESVEAVLSAIAEQDRGQFVLWGRLSDSDADAWHHALIEAERGDLMWLVEAWDAYALGAEASGVVFESLVDYALGEPRGDSDEQRRDRAWSWASDIATQVAGVELV